jgi:hypothetical protein
MARTITSANDTFTLDVSGLGVLLGIATQFQVQGFATDDAFDIEDSNPVEVRKGVDGKKSSGFTPFLVKQVIHLQADSASIDLFDAWLAAMKAQQEDITCDGSIVSPSVGKIYTLRNGSMTRISQMPPNKKVKEPQTYEITWDQVDVAFL